jgi:hypothetical protein
VRLAPGQAKRKSNGEAIDFRLVNGASRIRQCWHSNAPWNDESRSSIALATDLQSSHSSRSIIRFLDRVIDSNDARSRGIDLCIGHRFASSEREASASPSD